ncbi:glycosyl transferase [Halogeometricum borinquense DSM 11551]|uniref:Glycosyl transferase n=2 Tax=Halogeometricum borinquense TaxID=60847 RepID=E4NM84_HALBP|nr:S-layer glycoprotein N-glycosyltransferase AglJ [Halogeometricum borinquense]ADQ67289.1 glycosyl transferase [Halogeometricum borinquense DSM 11551]ELY28504.1 glycosyl transferase [Halogeometricum borinquense DSM 11551]RYJ13697.1 S-layer glycoprotein N-glycosyltransferase AglJ [Halogeometricum borinquense]
MDYDDVCILIPTYNEAETIGGVVSDYHSEGFENILVIDGGSDDETVDIAEDRGARVVMQSGSGKGQAIREAVEYHIEAPYVLMLDGDATYCAKDADTMLEPLDEGYEHVIGDRFADMHDGAMTRFNQLGNRIVNRAFATIHGHDFEDILSGYRAFTRDSFGRMTLTADGFGIETEMSVECVKRNIETTVVPITYRPRPSGSDTNLRPIRDGGIIFLELYRRAKTNNPLFYFGSVGGLSTAIGIGIALYVAIEWVTVNTSHEVLAVVAAAAILFGVQLLMFGVLSDLILSLHRDTLRKIDEETGTNADQTPDSGSNSNSGSTRPRGVRQDGGDEAETTDRSASNPDD